MRYKSTLLLAVLPLVAATCCRDKELLCGDPVIGTFLTYEVVDATTGQNWYAAPGRPPSDSLRFLPVAGMPAPWYVPQPGQTRLGPLPVYSNQPILNNQQLIIYYLLLGNGDIDTVQVTLHFNPNLAPNPCGYGPVADEVAVSYNGRPNGVFRASEPADSLIGNSLNKIVRLLKH